MAGSPASCSFCFDYKGIACNPKCHRDEFDGPMPLIGVYIAAASIICTLAMATDLFRGFRHRKLWLPCKFFTLNAASLTVIGVAMKLPVDLSEPMPGDTDSLAKLSSTALMCVMIGNFMPSIGTMSNTEAFTNIIALAILVITIIVNLCIQLRTRLIFDLEPEYAVLLFFMLVLLLALSFSSLALSAAKKVIEIKYAEANRMIMSEVAVDSNKISVKSLKSCIRKYWMTAVTGSPQYVVSRFVTSSATGIVCILTTSLLVESIWRIYVSYPYFENSSKYKWSTDVILWTQFIGVVIGTIAPAFRWLLAMRFKCSVKGVNIISHKKFKIEDYWTEKLAEWKENRLPLEIKNTKLRKELQGSKQLILTVCIAVEKSIVAGSKFLEFIPICISGLLISCWNRCFHLFSQQGRADHDGSRAESSENWKIENCVLLLEGEAELPERILKNVYEAADRMIKRGNEQQLRILAELLDTSKSFNGVATFDIDKVPSLLSREPPNCWTLPVVTLTSIALALPNISSPNVDKLLKAVSRGLVYARFVEKTLYRKDDLVNIRKTADNVWEEVELYRKWLDEDLRKISVEGSTCAGTLERLANLAESKVMNFKETVPESMMEAPLSWPLKCIAAYSMYRISKTILLDASYSTDCHDEQLLRKLSVLIADIFSACFTNLPRAIISMCNAGAIEERVKNVREAARLTGETEEILEKLQYREFPVLAADESSYIDNWRLFLKRSLQQTFSG